MEIAELIAIIDMDEDSGHQFKADITSAISLAQEMVAFSNSGGGEIFIGVSNDGTIAGLTRNDVSRINLHISNAASQHVKPSINPSTNNIMTPDGLVIRIEIANGINKPYMDKDGAIWVKSGSDKRKATSREEIQRLFQSAGLIHGDEVIVQGLDLADLDREYFKDFCKKNVINSVDFEEISLSNLLNNMNLMRDGSLNVSGALMFSNTPSLKLPVFIVKAITFFGNEIHETEYVDKEDILGKLADIFQKSISFIMRNIRHIQRNQGVNSNGKSEIPKIVFEELMVNALIHRDYFISAPIRLFIYTNRIEIISPGHLPNNLTIENIKMGNSNIRNPILASYATKILPYSGIGSGIIRALKSYPDIEFKDDRSGNQFIVTVFRNNAI
jgi:ATP-dependent DNA helicase RecG